MMKRLEVKLYHIDEQKKVDYCKNLKSCMSCEGSNANRLNANSNFENVTVKLKKTSKVLRKIIKENKQCKFVLKIDYYLYDCYPRQGLAGILCEFLYNKEYY